MKPDVLELARVFRLKQEVGFDEFLEEVALLLLGEVAQAALDVDQLQHPSRTVRSVIMCIAVVMTEWRREGKETRSIGAGLQDVAIPVRCPSTSQTRNPSLQPYFAFAMAEIAYAAKLNNSCILMGKGVIFCIISNRRNESKVFLGPEVGGAGFSNLRFLQISC